MTTADGGNPNAYDPHESVRQLAEMHEYALRQVVSAVYPEQQERPLTEIFPKPTEPRGAAAPPNWTTEGEAKVRQAVEPIGIGREDDRSLNTFPLPKSVHAFVEGGLVAKMLTELELVQATPDVVSSVTLSGSPHRELLPSEMDQLKQLLGPDLAATLKTEYDAAAALASQLKNYGPFDRPVDAAASYDIHRGFAVGTEITGQLKTLGVWQGKPVTLFRVDREDLPDRTFIHQPTSANVMRIIHDMLALRDDAATPIAYVTSATYPSRVLQAALVELQTGRRIVVPTYGTEHYATVRGGPAAPPPANQLRGEFHVMATTLRHIHAELAKK